MQLTAISALNPRKSCIKIAKVRGKLVEMFKMRSLFKPKMNVNVLGHCALEIKVT